MEPKLRTGVVGAGVFGAFHAAKHAVSDRVQLAGVFDTDAARALTVAARHGCRTFGDLDDLLASVDAVTISTPALSHFDDARRALEAGRHVYVEKPLAMKLSEADYLIGLAAEKNLVLQVGHQERFVFDALGAPGAGPAPLRLEMSRCGPSSGRGEDVSVVFDLMIHDLDMARLFGFGDLQKIAASGDRDETIATLTFERDRQASFIASRCSQERRREVIATYSDGALFIDFVNRTVEDTRPSSPLDLDAARNAFADPLKVSVDSFFAAIIDGEPALVDGKAGRRAIEWATLIEAARERLVQPERALSRKIA